MDGARVVARASGLMVDDLLALEGLPSKGRAVYVSGSLVEGLGNPGSDLDVYVVGGRVLAPTADVSKKHYSISIHYCADRRIDFEYWAAESVERIAGALSAVKVGEEFVADRLEAIDEVFVHRLLVGCPIGDDSAWEELRALFDADRFRAYLTQQAIHRVDGAIEDISGMVEVEDFASVLLRCRDVVGIATDAYAHSCGSTNPLTKWRARIVANLPQGELASYVRERYATLTFGAFASPDDGDAVRSYIEESVQYAHRVVNWIQG
jgi:predicted nucleotidyltransferase